MRRIPPVLVTFLLLVIPVQIFAKGDTVKITIKGVDLKTPIEITNPKILAKFPVWTGPGTGSSDPGFNTNAPGFIIDWSQGAIEEPPKGLQRYEVSFWANLPKERLIYVVFYEYDPATEQGYVYLPGRKDEWYQLNVSTIFHGVEGKWFRAWSIWDNVARPLIADARVGPSNAHRDQSSLTGSRQPDSSHLTETSKSRLRIHPVTRGASSLRLALGPGLVLVRLRRLDVPST